MQTQGDFQYNFVRGSVVIILYPGNPRLINYSFFESTYPSSGNIFRNSCTQGEKKKRRYTSVYVGQNGKVEVGRVLRDSIYIIYGIG